MVLFDEGGNDEGGRRSSRRLKTVTPSPSPAGGPVATPGAESPLLVTTLFGGGLRFDASHTHFLRALATLAFAEAVQELTPSLRLAYTRKGQEPTVASLIDPIKLDSTTIEEFTAQFSDDFHFSVVALLSVQCKCPMTAIPLLVTSTTTVGDVKAGYLAVWQQRQGLEGSGEDHSLQLYREEGRLNEVVQPLGSRWLLTWAMLGFPSLVYARVADAFPLYVRTMYGRSVELSVFPDTTIEEVKGLMRDREGSPPARQRLIYAGQQLEDGRSLEDYNLRSGATVHVVLRVRGC